MTEVVFLGRFQPFHKGHDKTVEKYKQKFSDFIVVIGSSKKSRTKRNPLTFEERKEIIESCHPDIEIIGLEDEDRGEEGYPVWTERLMKKTSADKVITKNELVQRLVREYSDAEIIEQELYKPEECSGTKIRESIRNGQDWSYLIPDCCEAKLEEVKDKIVETE